jgi:hypothetical protein
LLGAFLASAVEWLPMTPALYMINVDLESPNVVDCRSKLHEAYGRHYDLTVHRLNCGSRNKNSVGGRSTRFWDDNDGAGYLIEQVVQRVQQLHIQHPNAYARRCTLCGVDAHLPEWD